MGGDAEFGKQHPNVVGNALFHSRKFRQSHHRVHGSAKLMAHAGQKFALGAAFRLRFFQVAPHYGGLYFRAADPQDRHYGEQ